jgi:hypothetical protein
MSDVGTVIREEHEDGYSIWVLVHRALVEGYGSSEHVWRNPEWLCIESIAVGNCGSRLSTADRPPGEVLGAVPGTAAATDATPVLVAAELERFATELRAVLHQLPEYTHGCLAWRVMNDIDTRIQQLHTEGGA